MPEWIRVPDRASPGGVGQLRVDRRGPLEAPGAAPPLVVIGGMTQTLTSWSGQIRALAAARQVIVYEARGQGQRALSVDDVSPAVHVADFEALLGALEIAGPVDLCGFSFGGRMALAIAAEAPARVRRLVVSGVSAGRGVVGRLIVRAWREALRTGDLEALAWVSLTDILGPAYLERYAHMIEPMIKATVQRNDYEGIRALFEATLDDGPDAPHAPLRLAPRIAAPTLLLVGELDRVAPAADLEGLAAAFARPGGAEWGILPGVGHTIPIEAPEAWRARVLDFLDRPDAGAGAGAEGRAE
ncbi:MAG: alpha/beta fold hydrolase [Myxococcales bacterium]|nr:alpha/beta fold hydrolase [Myxococcales bacterium]MCB9704935.1 alpha/beta fold hydrolase [Myxococcales bacterium]